mgnify:CR=1 FL=1
MSRMKVLYNQIKSRNMNMKRITIAAMTALIFITAKADDGSRLWLNKQRGACTAKIETSDKSDIAQTAVSELAAFWNGCDIILSRDRSLPDNDGFKIERSGKNGSLIVKARRSAGLLYGAYELLRMQQTKGEIYSGKTGQGTNLSAADNKFRISPSVCVSSSSPAFPYRILNHWDNPDGSVERGYAGKSIWKWDEINGEKGTMSMDLKERLTIYCRANASIGINGSVLNNVNASPYILTTEYLDKIKVIADMMRPYGIKTYLAVNFASPMAAGGLETADPADAKVKEWWEKKVKEIYKKIPDFGGFLVKANSEGQPGPGDYHRTHAEGANMLAKALAPYNGIVMWRSFVYGNHEGEDRVKQAVTEFEELDGKFADNVILQSKNGPLDFQPREPYAPIFDRMKHTPMWVELQITQEYLGQSRHLVYLAPMWKEFFTFVSPQQLQGIAGVANTGDNTNWCGHPFSQSNWYSFGRLAWNPELASDSIAREWLAQTFTRDTAFINPMTAVMEASREACVDYMMPLGLHHIFKADHHYGPEPDGLYPNYPIEWCPVYYHKADSLGIGFDRTRTGTDAVGQYRHPYDSIYNDINACPEEYLLWFHHVSWDYKMKNGKTLWENLSAHYNRGVDEVRRFIGTWQRMRPYVDTERFMIVSALLDHQLENAEEWRDTCLGYFGKISGKIQETATETSANLPKDDGTQPAILQGQETDRP